MEPTDRHGFEVAILCALDIEQIAVTEMFDLEWHDNDDRSYGKATLDLNTYQTGKIGRHPVVVVGAWRGATKVSAADVAQGLKTSFPNIRLCLLVGVCGGVPKSEQGPEIFLGDVIVSNGLVEFDYGQQYDGGFVPKKTPQDFPGRQCEAIRTFLETLGESKDCSHFQQSISTYIGVLGGKGIIHTLPPGEDQQYPAGYRQKHHFEGVCSTCDQCNGEDDPVCEDSFKLSCETLLCDKKMLIPRSSQSTGTERVVNVHIGHFDWTNQVMISGSQRDKIAQKEMILALEMEGLEIWLELPTIIVKGVCDYADSHKDKMWQSYAAGRAAACAKAMLDLWQETNPESQTPTEESELSLIPCPSLYGTLCNQTEYLELDRSPRPLLTDRDNQAQGTLYHNVNSMVFNQGGSQTMSGGTFNISHSLLTDGENEGQGDLFYNVNSVVFNQGGSQDFLGGTFNF